MSKQRAPMFIAAIAVSLCTLTACAQTAPQATSALPETAADTTESADRQETGSEARASATRALQEAVAAGNLDEARNAIRSGADIEARGDQGRTPLIAATKTNQIDIAQVLLEAGADPNAKDDVQDSAFLYAGAEGLDEILRLTLEHGADVTSTNRFGGTALIPAAEHAHLSTIEILIDHNVPLDHINNLGWTALHEAIVLGTGGDAHVATVRSLLEAGASPTLPDGNGTPPRDLAAAHGYWRIVSEIDRHLG